MNRDAGWHTTVSVEADLPELVKNAEVRELLSDFDLDAVIKVMQETPEHQWPDWVWNVIDSLTDLIGNEGPVVVAYEAEQDDGPYSVEIVGWPGGYLVRAIEYEDVGLFPTLKHAKDFAEFNYGEFFV
jgi:hypothetical protein